MSYDIGEKLLESGLIDQKQSQAAVLASQIGDFRRGIDPGDPLFKIVILLGFAQPGPVALLVAKEMGAVAYVLIDGFPVDPHLALGIKREFADEHGVIPLVKDGKEAVLVAASSPLAPEDVKYLTDAAEVKKVLYLPVQRDAMPALIAKIYESLKSREVQGVRLGEILVREGLLSGDNLHRTISAAQASGMPLGRYLVQSRMVREDTLTKTLAGMANLPYVQPEDAIKLMRESSLKQRLKKEYVKFNMLLPYAVKNRALYVLTANPFVKANELPHSYGCSRMEMSVVMESTFALLFSKVYGEEMNLGEQKLADAKKGADEDETGMAAGMAAGTAGMALTGVNEADIRARYEHLVNRTILKAIEIGASDIHIENYESFVNTRLRVDGVLHMVPDSGIDKESLRGVINILKIEGGMNITETRQPQGGSFRKISPDGSPYDFRVQIMPSVNGETAVIRLLPGKKRIPTLAEIGFPPRILDGFERAVNNPSGLILLTGPTGSGKTTTLSSALAHVAQDPTCKVLTVEDPVEYQLPNVTQIETIPSKGVDFAAAARGFMRMDPDVILIGEIRDEETANEALKLAYSGHLTFSTLHTSSAVASVERMLGFGLDRTLLIEQMLAICSQRLVRRLCPHCREPYVPQEVDRHTVLYQGIPEGMRFFQSKGCDRCRGLGHLGRVMFAEFLNFTGNTRATFRRETEQNLIYMQLMGKGLEPMIDDAFNKVHQGYVDVRWLTEVIPQDYLELGPSSAVNLSPDVPLFTV
ncbi:MAG: Flp pilus assembly complex ATPase component TadA [Planctomycetota bacterium]|jgi:type IV pilus assembly protein PilB|nr:Flp pilus assembly complex ATPase component TadA [Planctomycetota bacterium]